MPLEIEIYSCMYSKHVDNVGRLGNIDTRSIKYEAFTIDSLWQPETITHSKSKSFNSPYLKSLNFKTTIKFAPENEKRQLKFLRSSFWHFYFCLEEVLFRKYRIETAVTHPSSHYRSNIVYNHFEQRFTLAIEKNVLDVNHCCVFQRNWLYPTEDARMNVHTSIRKALNENYARGTVPELYLQIRMHG